MITTVRMKLKRGMVGIEAAIVLIAFVIVAAALAFVVLNMGFFTTQKSKEAIGSGLQEASSAIEVDGSVIGKTNGSALVAIAIPLKSSTGKNPIDLSKTVIKIRTPTKAIILEVNKIQRVKDPTSNDPFTVLGTNAAAFIEYEGDDDDLLEINEKWILAINLTNANVLGAGLAPYTTVMVEIKPPTGAPLTVERMVPPNLSDTIIILES